MMDIRRKGSDRSPGFTRIAGDADKYCLTSKVLNATITLGAQSMPISEQAEKANG